MKLDAQTAIYGSAALLALYLVSRAMGAASRAGGAIADSSAQAAGVADDVISGPVGGIGSLLGLPTTGETIDDPYVVRWLIDNYGQLEASKWGTALAYFRALNMRPGSGNPPRAGQGPVSGASVFDAGAAQRIAGHQTIEDLEGAADQAGSFNEMRRVDYLRGVTIN